MGLFGFIGEFFSGVASAIATVGSAICNFAGALIEQLGTKLATAIEAIGKIIVTVANALGLIPEDESVEEIGAKAGQDGTRARMEDESMEEYLDYLRNDVKLDESRLAAMSPKERLGCSALGTAMVSGAIEENTGVKISPDFLVAMNKMKMSAEQFTEIVKGFSEKGLDNMDLLSDFFKGRLSDEERFDVYTIVEDTEKKLNPEASASDVEKKIDDMADLLNTEDEK